VSGLNIFALRNYIIKMKKFFNCRGRLIDLSTPVVMGILNVTPDSFFDGGKYPDEQSIFSHAEKMLDDGATIIDVGAQSTRPNSDLISSDVEWNRLAPVLKSLRKEFSEAIFSIDTFYSTVAANAVAEGADFINDVSGGTMDNKMFETAAKLNVPYVLMHIQGTPQTMQQNPQYVEVVKEVMDYFIERTQKLTSMGVNDIILDPGFGFGKTHEHNCQLLNHLDLFKWFEKPLLIGISRKSMVSKVLKIKTEEALNGTTVLNTIALLKGASILRVHDVREAVEAIRLIQTLNANKLVTS
jgi:dihydropteroate synthase